MTLLSNTVSHRDTDNRLVTKKASESVYVLSLA